MHMNCSRPSYVPLACNIQKRACTQRLTRTIYIMYVRGKYV